jgi:hypothetical protein
LGPASVRIFWNSMSDELSGDELVCGYRAWAD